MDMPFTIRDERSGDIRAIHDLTVAAFNTLAISCHREQFVIDALREAGAMTVSLVAEREGQVVGHVAFSPVKITDGSAGWFGLGPVSVTPALHRRGIGTALINEGLARLKAKVAQGCCLVGDPDYYRRFGFRAEPGFTHEGVPPQYFVVLPFGSAIPQGVVHFHEAFNAAGPTDE